MREVGDRSAFTPVRDNGLEVEPVGIHDRALVLGQAYQDPAGLLTELRDVIADVAQALYDDALAGDAGGQAQRLHVLRVRADLAQRVEQAAAGGFPPATDAALADRLARHAGQRIEGVGAHRLVCIDDPRHLALAGAVIGCRHVHAGADEVLLDQLVRVSARHAFQLRRRQLSRVHLHGALGPAKRHVDDRALPRHQRRQRHHLVFVDVGAVADAAFHRHLVVAVLGAPRLHDGDRSVVVLQGELEAVEAVASLDLVEQALGEGRERGRAIEAAIDVVEKARRTAHGGSVPTCRSAALEWPRRPGCQP